LFPSRDSQKLLNNPAYTTNSKYYFQNNFQRNDQSSLLNCIDEVPLRPSIEKKINAHSTKENFSKTTKKKVFLKQNSFERFSQSNNSDAINSFSFPNLEEIIPSKPNNASFMDLKMTTPLASNKNLMGGHLMNQHYPPTPSISGFLNNPSSLKDLQPIKNKSQWDRHYPPHQLESNLKLADNSMFNIDYVNSKFINNVSSIGNLDTFKAQFPVQKSDISDKLLKFALPNNSRKTILNGKFPSMKLLESNDFEPILGKRESLLESRIKLPSLQKQLKNPSTGQLMLSNNFLPKIISNAPEEIIKEINSDYNEIARNQKKPNSTTSLESKKLNSENNLKIL
jgi:hypothetical protein